MTTKSLREQFNRELQVSKIPYKDLADKETLEIWFKQFCKAPKKASYWLYRLQYYSDNEVSEIHSKKNDKIPESKHNHNSNVVPMAGFFYDTPEMQKLNKTLEDYNEKISSKTLEQEFYINDITQTPISKTLNKIENIRVMFLDSIYDESTDRYKEPLEVSKNIIKLLEQLPFPLSSKIIEDIENTDSSMFVFIIKEFGDRKLNDAQENKLKRMNFALIEKLNEWKNKIQTLQSQQKDKQKPENKNDKHNNKNQLLNIEKSKQENLYNLEYLDFLDLISGINSVKPHTIILNYDDEIIGTMEQLKDAAHETDSLELKKCVFELEQKVNYEISDLEIKKYLKKITDNFDKELTKTALYELEVFENMTFNEILNDLVTQEYKKRNWEIPLLSFKHLILGKNIKVPEYEKMRNRVFPFFGSQLYEAKKYLENALLPEKNKRLTYLDKYFSNSLSDNKNNSETKNIKTDINDKISLLKTIWLAEPKLSVEDFIQKGIDKGFWNNDLKILLQKNTSPYGSGKTFLGNLFIAFKGWSIPAHTDYKEAGRVFCEVFNIEIKNKTKEPYKAFSSINRNQVKEIKRTFGRL